MRQAYEFCYEEAYSINKKDRRMWCPTMRARALENQVFLAVVNNRPAVGIKNTRKFAHEVS